MKQKQPIVKSAPATSKSRILLFKLIAICIPFVLLVVLELALRLFGYGHDLSLFVTDPADEDSWVMNKYASEKFFSNTADATVGNAEKFRKEKTAGTLRIFVLGESTTIGYPYMHNGSFHRMLQYRLLREYPQMNTEIINLSLTGVNSFTVLDFASRLVDYSPDAVLIYCGHNEYYGAMGVASTNGISSNPLFIHALLALRGCRSWQLFNNGYATLTRFFTTRPAHDETLMKRLAGDQQVAYGSGLFDRGIEQFRNNLEQVCQLLSERKIPVFVSNLVSNEKSLEPFISGSDTASALKHYQLAHQYYSHGKYELAKQYFLKSKDEDLLRFRAPEQVNEIISDICSRYQKVYLVDAKVLFEKNSTGGILGEETLLEHVHPNLFGYALLSDAFYTALKHENILAEKTGNAISFESFRTDIPVTKVDSIEGAYEIAALKMRWPFHDTARELPVHTFEERMASRLLTKQITWLNMLDTLMPYYVQRQNYSEALKVAESAMLEYPSEAAFYLFAANYSKKLKDNARAEIYLRKAFTLRPSYELAKELVDLHLGQDDPEGSLQYLDYLVNQNRAASNLAAVKKMLVEMVALKHQLEMEVTKASAQQIAAIYRRLGYDSVALKYWKR